MRDDEFDRILSEEDIIVPSSGFLTSVMEAVRREAATPPPIPLPWKRALPGLVALPVALALMVWASLDQFSYPTTAPAALSTAMDMALKVTMGTGAQWVALGLLLSLASAGITMRLAR